MPEEHEMDEISRAIVRANAVPGSALEGELRHQIWNIAAAEMETKIRDQKLDQYIAGQRGNPRFESSFVAMPMGRPQEPKRPEKFNTLRLDTKTFQQIADGEIKVEKVG